jgi:AraC-like DNA-binding protein
MAGQSVKLSYSALATPPRDRIETIREVIGREIMRCDIEPLPEHPFETKVIVHPLSGAALSFNEMSPTHNIHTSQMIDDDHPVFSIVADGSCTWSQEGRVADVAAGQGLLTTRGAAGTLHRHVRSSVINIRLDRRLLAALVPRFEDALLRPIGGSASPLSLLSTYCRAIAKLDTMSTPGLGRTIALHLHDLVALALGGARGGASGFAGRGLRAARLAALKADIDNHLASPELSLSWLAGRHRISERTIREAFQADGTTFTDYVRKGRLSRAYRLLCDWHHADRRVAEIAYESGFNDLSYFYRQFGREYGATPSAVRAEAAGPQ